MNKEINDVICRIKNLGIEVDYNGDGIKCEIFMPNELLDKFADLMETENLLANS